VQKWILRASSGSKVAGQANGTSCTTAAYLNLPCGVYVALNDNVYVSDTVNNRVQLWTNGVSIGTMVAGTGRPKRKLPKDINIVEQIRKIIEYYSK